VDKYWILASSISPEAREHVVRQVMMEEEWSESQPSKMDVDHDDDDNDYKRTRLRLLRMLLVLLALTTPVSVTTVWWDLC
jgi:hypothetical protein